ncbi:helix-turn-helix domain-containing protein [Neobacillus sp. C211]|uniref:helix-turn-helix domain-containing protein n=1 Tax=unclassified Neobacillus TaxID=2675272 RepID=UPI00397D3DCB
MAENNEYKNGEQGLIAKWGNEVFDDGVMNAPMCITNYGYRFVTGGEFSFIMCLMGYKYDNRNPFPSQETIAKKMGVHVKQIERWVDSLFNKKGLINIYERHLPDGTRTSNEYDFSPLLEKCLEVSRKENAEKEPEVTKTKRERSKKNKEKSVKKTDEKYTQQNVGGTEINPQQNVGMDKDKMLGWNETECRDGLGQNVGLNKEIINKENLNNINLNKVIDDEGLSPLGDDSFNLIAKKEFEERFQEVFDRDMFEAIYQYAESIGIYFFTANEAERQYQFMLNVKGEENVGDYPTYFVNGIVRNRKSKKGALSKRKIKKAEEELKKKKEAEQQQEFKEPTVPIYNWLETPSDSERKIEDKPKYAKTRNSSYQGTDISKLKFKGPAFENLDEINFDVEDEDLPF